MYRLFGRTIAALSDIGALASAPTEKVLPVTPDDDADLAGGPCRSLWVGSAGTLEAVLPDGTPISNFPVFPGANPIAVRRVKIGTTATNIWAVY